MISGKRKSVSGREKLFIILWSAIFVILSAFSTAGAAEIQIHDAGQPTSAGASRAPGMGARSFAIIFGFVDARTQAGLTGQAGVTVTGPEGTKTVNIQHGTWFPVGFNGKYTVTVNASGYESASYSFDTAQWTSNKSITFKLNPASQGLLLVIVRDEGTKQGIGNASVTITGPVGSRTASTTSSQPTAVFQNIPYGNYQIAVTASGYTGATGAAQVTSPAQMQVTVWMNRGQGKVVFNVMAQWNGNPVIGAAVTVTGSAGSSAAKTGSNGIAAFAVPAGKVNLTIKASGFMDLRQDNITVPTSNNVNVYTLAKMMGVLNVTVKDVKKAPIRGAQVRAFGGTALNFTGVTDSKGNASLTVNPGTYEITVTCQGYKTNNAGKFSVDKPISVDVYLAR